jgi:hypothetical protein
MRHTDDITDDQAAQIDERLGQAFAFVRDMIDAPEVLEAIPHGGTLYFRDISWLGEPLRLTAHPAPDHPDLWTARVTGPAQLVVASRRWAPPTRSRGLARRRASQPLDPETAPTADAALDALEAKLRAAERDFWDPRRRGFGG